MNRVLQFLLDVRFHSVLGLVALAVFLLLGAEALKLGLIWAVLLIGLILLVAGGIWLTRKLRARRAAQALQQGIQQDAASAARKAVTDKDRAAAEALRAGLDEALVKIKGSKWGSSGEDALYRVPWYMIIGNPAAGKSMAVVRSGLQSPFADKSTTIIQGIGGTRDCDWFFSNDGILLDTAGRYAVHAEDRSEWLGFLKLLKKSRPLAPINGILVAASMGDLIASKTETTIALAKNLRQRVQELTDALEVTAPVYLVFTKADLIAGFGGFFAGMDAEARAQIWGATMPYDANVPAGQAPAGGGTKPPAVAAPPAGSSGSAVNAFNRHFDELLDGLREMGLSRMTDQRGQLLPASVLSFPLEFAALRPALQAFVGALFEDNPFQNRPVFRGFYFTSATQVPSQASSRASEEVASQFALKGGAGANATVGADQGFFLKDLFARVIFADRELVRQNKSVRQLRMRQWGFVGGAAGLGLALMAWSWAYQSNRQLIEGINADLASAVSKQQGRFDLVSRLEALEVLQRRLDELDGLRANPPLSLRLGLFQGEAADRKLRKEYFNGVRQVLMNPATRAMEAYLGDVVANADKLGPGKAASAAALATAMPTALAGQPTKFADASPTSSDEAYDALAAYLMLSDGERKQPDRHADSTALKLQVTKFWRRWADGQMAGNSADQAIKRAESLIVYTMDNLEDPDFPWLENRNRNLENQVRDALRKVRQGMPARQRVLDQIINRARQDYPVMSVTRILTERAKTLEPGLRPAVAGSIEISGAYTRQAWQGYIDGAIKDASEKQLKVEDDWVLGVPVSSDDNSMVGNSRQIREALADLYKAQYVEQWKQFLKGIAVSDFNSMSEAIAQFNRLGDPADSPIKHVLDELLEQTSWDNPSLLNEKLGQASKGFIDWLKQSLQNLSPSRVDVNVNVSGPKAERRVGPIGQEFVAVPRMMLSREGNAAPITAYLLAMGKVRTRLTELRDKGSTAGTGARQVVAATLEGTNSELIDANRVVEDQMLAGLTQAQRTTLRPLLVRPLEQAFSALLPETEAEVNRRWEADVLQPFRRDLQDKAPFQAGAAAAAKEEIARVFGAEGAIAKFGNDAMGPLVSRDAKGRIVPREWLGKGVRVTPAYAEGYSRWTAPLAGSGSAPNAAGSAAQGPAFEIQSTGSETLREHTLVIDGQEFNYKNMTPEWRPVYTPNPGGSPGAKITAVTNGGDTVVFIDERGPEGLGKMLGAATIDRNPPGEPAGVRLVTWTSGKHKLSVKMRLLPSSGAPNGGGSSPAEANGMVLLAGLRLPELALGTEAARPAGAGTAVRASGARP